jgi:hypothetical protein
MRGSLKQTDDWPRQGGGRRRNCGRGVTSVTRVESGERNLSLVTMITEPSLLPGRTACMRTRYGFIVDSLEARDGKTDSRSSSSSLR